ncbi:hypothetical protein [Lactobacillus johnsonii]|uniref:hypothetical protein n=1 Tax=Lactobacillus johnsonii TaxID=33959 RepID=UPI0021A85B4C|nr:hypothetical protein [Lactobacillus johnsonii]
MAIELKIGTRGTRAELLYTFTQDFLDEHGIRRAGSVRVRSEDSMSLEYNAVCYVIKTKYGFMCSLNSGDVLTYMGDGIWDLKPYKAAKSEDDDNPW